MDKIANVAALLSMFAWLDLQCAYGSYECNDSLVKNDPMVSLTVSTTFGDDHVIYGAYRSYVDTPTIEPTSNNRLYYGGWKAGVSDSSQWWQAEFPELWTIVGVITQGAHMRAEWVTTYAIEQSLDGATFNRVGGIFIGNSNNDDKTDQTIPETKAKYIRIIPQTWSGAISMRIDLRGCRDEDCLYPLVKGDDRVILSSSSVYANSPQAYGAHRGIIDYFVHETSNGQWPDYLYGAWISNVNDANQYIQIEFPEVRIVRGIVTQGANGRTEWVTSYQLKSSMDALTWRQIGNNWIGNSDSNTKVFHELSPFKARFIRFNPQAWYGDISMRVGILGCTQLRRIDESNQVIHPWPIGFTKAAIFDNDLTTCTALPTARQTGDIFQLVLKLSNISTVALKMSITGNNLGCDSSEVIPVQPHFERLYRKCTFMARYFDGYRDVCEYICNCDTYCSDVHIGTFNIGTGNWKICEIQQDIVD
ncbi:unnamed protein product [Owenia fusiformis]|uniref:Uncharacterized protein n=1 Tax=Owenia fusiformis TaxID=6347 RepID=A0A8J1Y6C6_OWEFU|nr:unnamed protein product [Owenia fusiformis]